MRSEQASWWFFVSEKNIVSSEMLEQIKDITGVKWADLTSEFYFMIWEKSLFTLLQWPAFSCTSFKLISNDSDYVKFKLWQMLHVATKNWSKRIFTCYTVHHSTAYTWYTCSNVCTFCINSYNFVTFWKTHFLRPRIRIRFKKIDAFNALGRIELASSKLQTQWTNHRAARTFKFTFGHHLCLANYKK